MRSSRMSLLLTIMATCLFVVWMLPVTAEGPALEPVPQAECGPGSIPEPGMQGRVPADDVAAGGAADGYRCNVEVVGRHGSTGGYKVERYIDAAGNECAFYDTTLLYPTNAVNPGLEPTGVAVLDMADPANPGAHRHARHPGDADAARVAAREP
jgi:hypothetical protein